MQVVQNVYDGEWLTVQSGKYEPVKVHIPIKHLEAIKKYKWCYEATKGAMYTMDFSMDLPRVFNFKTPRVYLWRYITYLETGDPKAQYPRRNLADYRFDVLYGLAK